VKKVKVVMTKEKKLITGAKVEIMIKGAAEGGGGEKRLG
jgi:hypothetical protein